MAEKGSAGQVGGMEAKAEVRERLARESKSWRCQGCGCRPNSEIMREWWEICKERGVKVEEEMSLEDLPEGLHLEAREPGSKSEGKQNGTETRQEPPQAVDSTMPHQNKINTEVLNLPDEPLPSVKPAALAGPFAERSSSINRTQAEKSAPPEPMSNAAQGVPQATSNTPSEPHDPRTQVSREHASHHSNHHERTHRNPPANLSQTTTPAPTPTTTTHVASQNAVANNNNAEALATGTLDKAIGALFLALLFMVLKKIFYPSGGSGPGGSMDGLYMSGD